MTTETITYQQLCEQGLSDYQVRYLTQSLIPVGPEGEHLYRLRDVITEVRHYLNSNRLPPLHREAVNAALESLLAQLDNVVTAPFGLSRDEQIGFHIQKVLQPQRKPMQTDPASIILLSNGQPEALPNTPADFSGDQHGAQYSGFHRLLGNGPDIRH